MEMQNFSVYCRKNLLKFEIIVKSLTVTVKSWQGGANISVR